MTRALRMESRSKEHAALAAAGACALTGVAMATRPELAPLIGGAAVLVAMSLDWRRGVIAMLVVLPFAGLPVFIAGTPGLALRDLAVTAPLYAAFAFATLRGRDDVLPPLGVALPALAVLAAVACAGVLWAPSMETGVIGVKVWLAYVPMLAIGYRYVRRIEDFECALRVTALIGLVPALIALCEWALAARHGLDAGGTWVNDFGPFTRMYGAWFENVKFSRVEFGYDSHAMMIPRVPSTFTSVSQYFAFSMTAYAAGLAVALRRRTGWWALCAFVLGAAVIATGMRAAYVAVPALTLASMALAGAAMKQWTCVAMLVVAALGCGALAGAAPWRVATMIPAHAQQQVANASTEFNDALRSGPFGHGTGWDTNSALRYGGSGERRYVENWYAKAALELGIAGLAAVVVAFAAIGVRLATPWRRLDARSRQLAGPVLALLGVMAVALFKGPYIDLDPMNVYFWLFAGMLFGLYRCTAPGAREVQA
jgi:hypothetical protein